jgi:hypothetical protein
LNPSKGEKLKISVEENKKYLQFIKLGSSDYEKEGIR